MMGKRIGGKNVSVDVGEYLTFEFVAKSESGKTDIWRVNNHVLDVHLGHILWNPGWRQYWFMPIEGTGFAVSCLIDIAEFCKRLNEEHRNG